MLGIRKIAAILVSDVVGNARLASADQDLARLRTLRHDLIDPTIAVHDGRVVKRTDDKNLVEFRSVVEPVRCAKVERNAGMTRYLPFRGRLSASERAARSLAQHLGPKGLLLDRLRKAGAPECAPRRVPAGSSPTLPQSRKDRPKPYQER
jgi:adenylate cyclase